MFGCTLLLKRSFQTSVLKNVKSESKASRHEVGNVIKRLNTENKSLFGKLLETRPQKRMKERTQKSENVNDLDLISNVKSELSSELWWWEKSSPGRIVKLSINRSSAESNSKQKIVPRTNQTENHKMINKEVEDPCAFEIKTDTAMQASGKLCINEALHHPDMENNNGTNESEASGTLKNDLKKTPLRLPDIIIKNIGTFPLKNEQKKNLKCKIFDKNVLNISANDESDSKSKVFMAYPSVTRILNATMSASSQAALKKWKEKMIAQLGEEGFVIFQEGLLEHGSQFHSVVQSFLSGTPASELPLEPAVQGCWDSLAAVMPDLSEVKVLESHVVHPFLKYRGVIDCVAQYRGKPVLIEWKKSDKQKPDLQNTYDAPIQLCAYLGAMNYDPKYNLQVRGGLVVVAYSDGSPANTFRLSASECNKYWGMWRRRLQQYWLQRNQAAD